VADAPSDIFSCGSVLWEMLSGQRPFARATAAETMAAILKDEPPPLHGMEKKLPANLERVIRHCLEKKPSERYQAARDLAFDLKAMVSGGDVTAPLPVRRRTAVWRGAAAMFVLLVVAAWLFWGGERARAIDSIAVLPLVNASGDVNLEYLSDGITESLINSLSQLPQLKRVIARSSVESYKGKPVEPRKVGQELNVRAVLTGKVIQRGEDLSLTTELVNVADGARLWGQHYNRKLTELLAVQEEIAQHISESLRLKLSGSERQRLAKRPTTNIEAHQLYLKGRYHWGKADEDGLKKALEYFKQAIDLDPNYALAYAGMADVYYFLSDSYWPAKEAMPRALAAAQRALQLDETLAEAHIAVAEGKFQYDWEWTEAERAFKRVLELNPGHAFAHNQYGMFLVAMGRFAEAQREMERARELDPLSPYIHVGTAWPVYFARQYEQAITQLRRIVALNPDFPNAYTNLGWSYVQKGMYEEAIVVLRKAQSLDDAWPTLAWLGHTYARAGQQEQAQKVLAELQERAKREHVSGYGLALVYLGLGEKEQAVAALEKAYQLRDGFLPFLKVDPFFDSLRSDPRFIDLLQRLKLAP
jgi:TolB-like protein/Flp pilus assembly protein TadD